jgi:hypothetical protein
LTVVGTRAYNTILNSGMSIEIINAWAQFVAALGVIGSLFYLAAQVRQSSRSSQALVVDSLARSMHDLAFAIAKDTELLRVLTEILPNWDASTEMDKARASSLILGYFKLFENAWFQMRKGMLEHDQWQGTRHFFGWFTTCHQSRNGGRCGGASSRPGSPITLNKSRPEPMCAPSTKSSAHKNPSAFQYSEFQVQLFSSTSQPCFWWRSSSLPKAFGVTRSLIASNFSISEFQLSAFASPSSQLSTTQHLNSLPIHCLMSLFVSNTLIGWIGGFYEKMTPAEFWAMQAAIAAGGGLLVLLFGRRLHEELRGSDTRHRTRMSHA